MFQRVLKTDFTLTLTYGWGRVLSCSELNIPALIRRVNKEFSLIHHQQIKYGPNTASCTVKRSLQEGIKTAVVSI